MMLDEKLDTENSDFYTKYNHDEECLMWLNITLMN